MKNRLTPYPTALQNALIQKFAWEMNFSLGIAQKSIAKADVAYAAGCCFNSVMCMLQVLFAINHVYWLNEKGAVAIAEKFAIKPDHFQSRINDIFGLLRASPESISQALARLKELSTDMYTLVKDSS